MKKILVLSLFINFIALTAFSQDAQSSPQRPRILENLESIKVDNGINVPLPAKAEDNTFAESKSLTPIIKNMNNSSLPVIILVHGAWFGSSCWTKTTPLLEAKGYKVLTFDLPGYGSDTTDPATITLDDYVEKLAGVANSVEGKVILLGHSMGGAIISQTAEVLGTEKVAKLIFLDAFLLKDGESILQQVGIIDAISKANGAIEAKHIETNFLTFSEDGKTCTVMPDVITKVFCHDCPAADQALVRSKTIWQPVAALATPIKVSSEKYGTIPKFYIQCTEARDLDRTSILQNVHCQKYYTLPSSHSPFFSMPEKLVAMLDEICRIDTK